MAWTRVREMAKGVAVRRWLHRAMHGRLTDTGIAILVAAAVTSSVLAVRAVAVLEPAELAAYDAFVRTNVALREVDPDPRIVIVTVTERDIQELGAWPLPDGVLARMFEGLLALGPRAIGLDIYRDVPVAPGTAELDDVLRRDPRIIVVTKFAEGSSAGVRPPAVLAGTEQVGFNDIVIDAGGTIRRALLFLDDGQTIMYSFALRLALLYLAPDGIGLGPDPADESMVRIGRTTIRPLGRNDGPYVGLDAGGYQFMADFRGGPETFTRVTLGALLRGDVPADAVRDRIALVGVTAESVKDDFYTPLQSGLGAKQHVPGVEVHAHFTSQLLRVAIDGQAPMRSLPGWLEWLSIGILSALGTSLGTGRLRPWRLVLALGLGLAVIIGVAFVMFVNRWWWPVVPPGIAWVAATGLVVAYQAYRESVERGMLMNLFSQHVSKEVADAIWNERERFAEGGRPAPQNLVVTALFTDLTGYTTVSERLTPESLIAWLNESMEAMAGEISCHGGVIRQYAGDSIVALFGAPVPRTTNAEIAADAVNAVRCALAMERRLLQLNHEWRAAGRPVTGMRIGIVTGPATSGTLGSRDRWEYVVVGDTLNTAARLEAFDKDMHAPDPFTRPARILAGESTLMYVADRFEAEWVAERQLKGKEQLVAIYRILAERRDTMAAEAPLPSERV
jgi:adenylate cyclase